MIINKEKNKEIEKEKKKNILQKFNKKKIIVTIILLLVIIGSIIIVVKSKQALNISIDIISKDIGYSYGPNSSTNSKLIVGQDIELNIMTDKALFVKCYSSNENVIEFIEKNKARAKKAGSAQLYCEANNQKSNVINVLVGD